MTVTALPAREGSTLRVMVCHHDGVIQRTIRDILEAGGFDTSPRRAMPGPSSTSCVRAIFRS
jgi:hypothetical protein